MWRFVALFWECVEDDIYEVECENSDHFLIDEESCQGQVRVIHYSHSGSIHVMFLGRHRSSSQVAMMSWALTQRLATSQMYIIPLDALTVPIPFYSNLVRGFPYNTGATNGCSPGF